MSERIVVAGASGFVGAALPQLLRAPGRQMIGLSRAARADGAGGYDEWRGCDLYSLLDAERALEGATLAIYLVHAMMPSARLTQGRFDDFDLISADNFARAAKQAGVRRIVYVGGLVPSADGQALSLHLSSRREVERSLAAHGVPLVALRAGLVIGHGGSSFTMLQRLVRRLPLMACPRWTRTPTEPIALADLAPLIAGALLREDVAPDVYDVGGDQVLTYEALMQATAAAMGVRRPMLPVPLLSPRLSRLWVSTVTGAPKALVAPLIQSLEHPMVARDHRLQALLGARPRPLAETLDEALRRESGALVTKRSAPRPVAYRPAPASALANIARSVQRLPLPDGWRAADVARAYIAWLPRRLRGLLRVRHEAGGRVAFHLWGTRTPLLILRHAPERSTPDRPLLYVEGGTLAGRPLAGTRARLEFREVLEREWVLAAVLDFAPRLPWPLYVLGQAPVHLWVMNAFGAWLWRQKRAGAPPPHDDTRGLGSGVT